MLRLGCLFVVALLIAIPAVAAQFLPWWGTVLVILGEAALLLIGGPKLVGFLTRRFMMNLFLTKSRVLRDASMHVVSVRPVERTTADDDDEKDENDEDEEDDDDFDPSPPEGSRFVEIEFTVTPRPGGSRMNHWEPGEMTLVPYDAHVNESAAWKEDEDEIISADVHHIDVIDEAGNATSDFDKLTGTARLRGVFAIPPTLNGRVKFRYYFEQFGDVMLP